MAGGGGAALLQSTALLDLGFSSPAKGEKARRVYDLGELGFYRLELQSY
jgi:hypothetical protein